MRPFLLHGAEVSTPDVAGGDVCARATGNIRRCGPHSPGGRGRARDPEVVLFERRGGAGRVLQQPRDPLGRLAVARQNVKALDVPETDGG